MNRHFKLLFIFVFFILSCRVSNSFAVENKKIPVTVSMSPYDFFVKKIAGDLVEIYTLIPTHADHETYEPGLAKISKVAQSNLYITINSNYFNFEKKLEKHLKDLPNNKTILLDSSKGIELTAEDPHLWTSPSKVKLISKNILSGLQQILPEQSLTLQNNLKIFLEEIDQSNLNSQELLKSFPGKTFYSYHKSWAYFAADFHLTNAHIETEGKEPSLAQQNKLLTKMKAEKANLIILENPEQEEKLRFLKDYISFKAVVINAQEYDWLENQKKLTQTLLEAFSKIQ